MEQDRIIDKISKLLRLAKSGGAEGAVAQQRAAELMQKHGLKVTLEQATPKQKRRAIVENVPPGWQEALLVIIAHVFDCKILGNHKDPTIGMIVGEDADVRVVEKIYKRISTELLTRVKASWEIIFRVTNDLASRTPQLENMWYSVVEISAAQALITRIFAKMTMPASDPETPPEPANTPSPAVAAKATPAVSTKSYDEEPGVPDDVQVEIENPEERPTPHPAVFDVKQIAYNIGGEHVRMMQWSAQSFGKDIAGQIDISDIRPRAKKNYRALTS